MCTSDIDILLELSAADDLEGLRSVVEREGYDVVNESGLWYGRSIGSKKMRLEERTPLMIAAIFGSKQVLKFVLELNCVDVNKACGSDGATALHLAVAGCSSSSIEVIKLLIDASADISCLDVRGNRPVDLIPLVFGSSVNSSRKLMEFLLNGCSDGEELRKLIDDRMEEEKDESPNLISSPDHSEKKGYPVDLSLPDMTNGMYSTDEFRMYTFKIKPCSRAYSHDWTECPFVHPGENARRRDPRKYHYSCVPCPEFRKGSCRQGDACEYAHGIFECWLHPAQYRTRLCKDEIGCNRKVCFFAHKHEELRPLHPSTGSAVLSPQSFSLNSSDILSISPFSLGSPSIMIPPTSSPLMTPGASSPRGGNIWSNQSSPTMKFLNTRFKTNPTTRDLDLDYSELLASMDPMMSQFQNLSLDTKMAQLRQNMNYSSGLPSSPLRMSSPSSSGGFDQILNSRSSAFAKRSQSFIDRGAVNHQSGFSSPVSSSNKISDWGSPDGKLNWGIQKEEINKLRKSASFGVRSSGSSYGAPLDNVTFDEDQYFSPWMEQEKLFA